jgi:hypothetical protein
VSCAPATCITARCEPASTFSNCRNWRDQRSYKPRNFTAAAHRPRHRAARDAEHLLNLVKQVERLTSVAVELVDEGDDWDATHPANVKQLPGLGFHSLRSVEEHQCRVHRRKRAVCVFAEVVVTRGVEQVQPMSAVLELHCARGHRDPALALQLHLVARRVPLGPALLDRTGKMDGAAIEQDPTNASACAPVPVATSRTREPGPTPASVATSRLSRFSGKTIVS